MSARQEAKEWIKCIVVSIVIAFIIRTFLFNSTKVLGSSMYPTLHENDRLFTNRIVYTLGEPKRGDIVILKAPDDKNKDYIKRIIGVAGDKVEIKDGKVYVNGEEIKEDYTEKGAYTYSDESMWEVPKGSVFVLGDNRQMGASKDSRALGLIPVDLIKGKASYRYFPIDRFGSLYK
ncbi:signal peptidase I [Gottschalkia purinilytica]|uniref:Signal peptidase I n=1 Tax=Gottschalkia purinilytica TaxID=1503 RepID=A0A0L0WD61_GOTPU|nr:signal peptidase I [Gottschalkia purinilytica]KNF09365.1 signal peptidase I [Gottschalkia purinilytica]